SIFFYSSYTRVTHFKKSTLSYLFFEVSIDFRKNNVSLQGTRTMPDVIKEGWKGLHGQRQINPMVKKIS
ncbi:MAG: hypothetical protein ACQZ3N_01580, partial [cyanobacterium endosymbiont of Rhopalodia yunnanensis]